MNVKCRMQFYWIQFKELKFPDKKTANAIKKWVNKLLINYSNGSQLSNLKLGRDEVNSIQREERLTMCP